MLQWWRRILQRILGPFLARRWRIPRVQAARVIFNPVDVHKNEHDQCWLQLGANVHGGQGMVLTVAVEGRPNGGGSIEFVQLMKPRRLRSRVSTGNNEIFTSDADWVLDGNDPYVPARPVAAGKLSVLDMHDTPGSSCAVYLGDTAVMSEPLELIRADDRFRIFILWRPDHLGGTRVPIGHVDWQWKGEAMMTQSPDEDCEDDHANGDTYYWRLTSEPDEHSWSRRVPDYFTLDPARRQ